MCSISEKILLYDQTSAPKSARFEEEQETKAAVEAPTAADAEVKTGIAAEAVHCDNTLSSADALTEVGARVHPNSFMIGCLLIKIVQSCGFGYIIFKSSHKSD